MPRGRPPGAPQAVPQLEDLLKAGVPPDLAALARLVGEMRYARGWTWQQLADKAELNHRQVRQLEAGERDISYTTLIKLCRVFEFGSLAEFFEALRTPGTRHG